MYKIIQNMNSFNNDYEYSHEYETVKEAEKTIAEYEQEDRELGGYHLTHDYTIVYSASLESVEEKERDAFNDMALCALKDITGVEEEAAMLLEDYHAGY